ncbi:hypothetical protein NMG60_11006155 [Bertholletia excelsa]
MNGSHKTPTNSLWNWKGTRSRKRKKHDEKRLSIPGLLEHNGKKIEAAIVGPGGGIGIGFRLVAVEPPQNGFWGWGGLRCRHRSRVWAGDWIGLSFGFLGVISTKV